MTSKTESSGICALFIVLFILNGVMYYKTRKELAELKAQLFELHATLANSTAPPKHSEPQKYPPYYQAHRHLDYQ